MNSIPKPVLLVGLMGLVPFALISGLQLIKVDKDHALSLLLNSPKLDDILIFYGIIILSFISGSFWTMVIKSDLTLSYRVYVISVLPSILMFVFLVFYFLLEIDNTAYFFLIMINSFIGILMFDLYFSKISLTPRWWLKLRFMLTPIVLITLLVGLIN
jgi:hypothetical protein